MTVYWRKARKKWVYDFQVAGERFSGNLKHPKTGEPPRNKTEAEKLETQMQAAELKKAEARGKEQAVAEQPGGAARTFAYAMLAYGRRKKGQADWVNKKRYIDELLTFFGRAAAIGAISEQRIWDYIAWSREQLIEIYIGAGMTPKQAHDKGIPPEKLWRKTDRLRSETTINKYLNPLREAVGIMHRTRDAAGQRLLEDPPKVPKLREPKHLPRPIADVHLEQLVADPLTPPHLVDAVVIIRNMGFRKAEVAGLTVDHVSLQPRGIWLSAEETKGDRDTFVPANDDAWIVIERRYREAKAGGWKHLIVWRPKESKIMADRRRRKGLPEPQPVPVKNPKRAFASAMKRLGLEGQHKFHNTKASFLTQIAISSGGSSSMVKRAGRHKDIRTSEAYIEVADQLLREAMEAVSFKAAAVAGSESQPAVPASDLPDPGGIENLAGRLVGATGFEPATPRPPVLGSTAKLLKFRKKDEG